VRLCNLSTQDCMRVITSKNPFWMNWLDCNFLIFIYGGRCFVFFFFLFSLSPWDLPNHGASCRTLGTITKLLMSSRGASRWFHNYLTYSKKVIEYWRNFLLKIHLKIYMQIRCILGIVGKPSTIRLSGKKIDPRNSRYWNLSNFCH
jgi:hypothetical protein